MATVNEEYLNNMIKHKIQIDRLSSGMANRVFDNIKDRIKKSIDIPDNISDLSETQVMILKGNIERKIKDIIVIEYDNLEKELKEYAIYEKQYVKNMTERVVPTAITIKASEMSNDKIVDKMRVKSRSLITKDAFEKISDKSALDYGNTILNGYREGMSREEIARRIFNTENNTGRVRDTTELKKLRNNLRTLSRTCCNSINSEVNKDFFESNNDIIEGYLFVSTLDSRTSTICGSLDGTRFEKGAEPNLPLHYNCRSVLLPIIKGSDDLNVGTRKSMDGKVPKTQNYEEWLRNQDRETIEDILGKRKADLFLKNEVPIERFVNLDTGKDYTVKEMAIREGIELKEV